MFVCVGVWVVGCGVVIDFLWILFVVWLGLL